MNESTLGLVILLIAGVMNASFTLPMKFTRKWAWENTWLVFAVLSLWVLPLLVAFTTVPGLGGLYSAAGSDTLWKVVLFGVGWGLAQVFFGLAVDAIGIALAFSIILGLSAALGSVMPLFQLQGQRALSTGGVGLLAFGLVLVGLGVSVLAIAGQRRERARGTQAAVPQRRFGRGLFLAISAGVLAACMNVAFTYGRSLAELAGQAGIGAAWQTMPIWLLITLGGSVANVVYCIHLLRKNSTAGRFRQEGTTSHWFLALAMALAWFVSTLLYGVASLKLGTLGPVLGWPLFMSLIVITASILGLLTGEWKNAGRGPVRIMLGGVAFLIMAVFVLAAASRRL